jgi:predicted nucleotide-binding protein (sugar kinase/HSP70/actin superfamily)
VGIVGEFYTAMDAFSNLELEQKLADMGVEVHRWMNVTNQFIRYGNGQKNLRVKIQDLCAYDMGPTSTANIWYARECAERGFDGLVHVKSAACTPEIDVMPVLQNISGDYKIPVLYLTYDAQTSDVGLMTRLEAFYDMIDMRKKVL